MSKKLSLVIPGKERPNLISLFHDYIVRKVQEDKERYKNGRHIIIYDCYDDEYREEMEQLRRFYGGCFPNSGYSMNDDWDDDWDDDGYDDYEVGDDGEIIFPSSGTSQTVDDDPDRTLRPGEYRRSKKDMDEYWNKMKKFNGDGGKVKHKHRKHRGGKGKKAKTVDINSPYNSNFIDDGDALTSNTIYFYEDYHDKYSRVEFESLMEFDEYCNEMGFFVPAYVGEAIAYSAVSHCCLNPLAKEQGILEVMREETYGDMFYEACETSELSD